MSASTGTKLKRPANISEYGVATKRFSKAVSELQQKMGVPSKAEYDRLARAGDEARVKSGQARLAHA